MRFRTWFSVNQIETEISISSGGVAPTISEQGQQIVRLVNPCTVVMACRHKDISKGIFQGVSDRVLVNFSDGLLARRNI